MGHYDCKDCGASLGLHFGVCTNCTPKELLDERAELKEKEQSLLYEWESMMRSEKLKWVKEQISDKKEAYYKKVKAAYKEKFENDFTEVYF